MSPKVSVVISEYNTKPEYLDDSIRSILGQTFHDFELIIVDDKGSNDVSRFVKKYNDSRIRVIKNRVNQGLAASLNRGIHEARGKYIVRMDTDDIALPNRISKIYKYITKHTEFSVVGSRAFEFSDNKEVGVLSKAGEKTSKSFMRRESIVHPTVIMKKKDILEVGGYPTNYYRAEDLGLWCRLFDTGKRIYIIDDLLLRYRVNLSDYKRKRRVKEKRGEFRVRLKYYKKFKAKPIDYLRIPESIVMSLLPAVFTRYIRSKLVLSSEEKER